MAAAMKLRVLAVCLLFSASLLAKDRHMPLPDQLVHATYVYIANRTGDARAADAAYTELSKIQSYHLTSDLDKADVVLVIQTSVSNGPTLFLNNQAASAAAYGNTAQANGSGSAIAIPLRTLWATLAFGIPKTETVLWTETRAGSSVSVTKSCMKSFRKRLEESTRVK